MLNVIHWGRLTDLSQALRPAVQALRAGRLVAFPTETVYGLAASARLPEAVARLVATKGRPDEKPFTLALAHPEQALDWVPAMSPVARRLARRCWPGPLTLVCPVANEAGLTSRVHPSVRMRICPAGSLGLRIPGHEAILSVLDALAGPLVLSSANHSGAADALTADAVLRDFADHLDVLIDDGPCRYGRASTVVQVNGQSWKVLRPGIVSEESLKRLSACIIVFVCTGNTCRSPLAEALCKRLLAERLGISPLELTQRGFVVLSAGLAAMMGGAAAPEAVEVARDLGTDLTEHRSQPLTAQLVGQADYIVAMTRSHLLAMTDRFPNAAARLCLLDSDGDIPDPIGAVQEVYRHCAQQILHGLERFVPEVQAS